MMVVAEAARGVVRACTKQRRTFFSRIFFGNSGSTRSAEATAAAQSFDTNPLLHLLQQEKDVGGEAEITAPDWRHVQPSHVPSAAKQAADLAQSALLSLKQTNNEPSRATVNAIVAPVYTVLQTTFLLSTVLENNDSKEWQKELRVARQTLIGDNDNDETPLASPPIPVQQLLVSLHEQDHQSSHVFAQKVETMFGLWPTPLVGVEDDQYKIQRAFAAVRENLLQHNTTVTSPALLADIYNSIGLHTEYLKQQQWKDDGDHSTTIARSIAERTGIPLEEHRRLQHALQEQMLPLVRTLTGTTHMRYSSNTNEEGDDDTLDSLLRPTGHSDASGSSHNAPSIDPVLQSSIREDRRDMLRLEQHVTLDGALAFSFHMCRELLGFRFERVDADASGWHPDVWLYKVLDDTTKDATTLGYVYLDLLDRYGTAPRPVTIPLRARNEQQLPMVCLSLGLEAPAFDDTPTMMSWQSCEDLLHEMGHVVQWISASSNDGCLDGAMQLSLASAEVLPHFMEKWLTEQSTILALLQFSNVALPTDAEEAAALHGAIAAALRVRSRAKTLKLAEQLFHGQLELSLLDGFDLKGSAETIPQCQERLANELLAFAEIDPEDLGPTVRILQQVHQHRGLSGCQYLWADAMSAQLFAGLREATQPDAATGMTLFRQLVRQHVLDPGAKMDPHACLQALTGKGAGVTAKDLLQVHCIAAEHLFPAELDTKSVTED